MSKPIDDVYELAERALDVAILEKRFLFKLHPLLTHAKATRKSVLEFLESTTARAIEDTAHDTLRSTSREVKTQNTFKYVKRTTSLANQKRGKL